MWLLIGTLVVIGLALIIVEVIFVPGTTIVGILGVVFLGAAVLTSYKNYGSEVGMYTLLGTGVATGVTLFFAFRSNSWMRFANKSAITSRVNEGKVEALAVGDEGIALSTLKPVGKVQFKNGEFEVKTLGDYVDVGAKVRIVHVDASQVIVKPTNN
jgi:membrane-bound ClpP family serine protease